MRLRHMDIFVAKIGVLGEIRSFGDKPEQCVLNFSVVENPPVKTASGNYEDGPAIWTDVSLFGNQARNLHRSVVPGTAVMIAGRREANSFIPKGETEPVLAQKIVAENVALVFTNFTYVKELGNVNYAKEGTEVSDEKSSSSDKEPLSSDDLFKKSDGIQGFEDIDDPIGITD